MQCSGSLWNQLWSMHGFCTSACITELAGMELAHTHLEFHIAIVLAMVAEWEDVSVISYYPDGLATASPRSLLKTCLAKKSLELFW